MPSYGHGWSVAALAVESHEVVVGQPESADGWLCLQASMWPVPVVAMQPEGHLGSALLGAVIRRSIDPFA